MNFLAHVLLAGENEADRLGGILGDFVKGVLPAGLPPDVAAGVALHRHIDSFSELHPAYRQSRARVSAMRRRYAGIMVDMFYDHLLAANWAQYSAQSLDECTAQTYRMLSRHIELLPPRLAGLLPNMIEDDWLGSYRTLSDVGDVLERMARYRLKQPGTLPGAIVELKEDYAGFAADFEVFMVDALQYANDERKRLASMQAG